MTASTLSQLAARVSETLRQRGESVSTAESCTGGWIAKTLTDLAGSSALFTDGFVTYSNAAKTRQLGVDAALIEQHGAVSEPVVVAMANGARQRSQADYAIAVSGVAGPGGGSADKPVGTVWIAWAQADDVRTARYLFAGDRDAIRRLTVEMALATLDELINNSPV
ncbi:MAG: CinA family protein [Gammaproteobacteria bacterium]